MSDLPSYAHRAIIIAEQHRHAGQPPAHWRLALDEGDCITGIEAAQQYHPLRYAAARNDVVGIKRLLAAGHDPNLCDSWGYTAAREAVETDHGNALDALLTDPRTDRTDALMWSVSMPQAGHAGIIAGLLSDDIAHVPPGPADNDGAEIFYVARERALEIARWYTASTAGDRLTAAAEAIDKHIHARRAAWERQQLAAVAEGADRTSTKRRM